MPKRRNDAALTKGVRCLYAPMMGKLSKSLGTICLEVLGDYVINDLRREVADLRGYGVAESVDSLLLTELPETLHVNLGG